MYRILVAVEDRQVRKDLCKVIKNHGYETIEASNGREMLGILEREYVNIVLCELSITIDNNKDIKKSLQFNKFETPIIYLNLEYENKAEWNLLLKRTDEELFEMQEMEQMLCRLGEILNSSENVAEDILSFGDISVCLKGQWGNDRILIEVAGKEIFFPREEAILFITLLFFPNKIFTKLELLEKIDQMFASKKMIGVDQMINNIKELIKDSQEVEIVEKKGLGFKLVKRIVSDIDL